MSDVAAAAATAPVVTPAPAPPAAAPTQAERSAKARDLAGKFLNGSDAKELAAPPADGKAPAVPAKAKPGAPTKLDEPPAKTEAEIKAEEDERYRKFRQKKKALRTSREELQREKARIAARDAEADADEKLKEKDPHAWLEKHRFDLREVAKREIAKDLPPEQKAAKEKEDARDRELEELKKWKADQQKRVDAQSAKEAMAELAREATTTWEASKETYPTLAAYYEAAEVTEEVTRLRVDHYRKTLADTGSGEELSAAQVLAYLEKKALKEASRFTPREIAEGAERATAAGQPAKTRAAVRPPVTNRDSSTRASPAGTKPTASERRARAEALAAKHWDG